MKFNTIIILFGLTLIISCSKDEAAVTSSIVGAWEQVSQIRTNCIDPINNSVFNCPKGACDVFTFDGSRYSISNANISTLPLGSGAYKLVEDTLILISDLDGSEANGIYALTTTTLTWTYASSDCTVKYSFLRK